LAVVGVGDARGGFELAFAVPDVVGHETVARGVATQVVAETRKVIVGIRRFGEATFLQTACIRRVGCGGVDDEISPGVVRIRFAPAVSRASGVGRSSLRRNDAIQWIVSEGLRTSRVEIVGDTVDVGGISLRRGINEIIGDVKGVATS